MSVIQLLWCPLWSVGLKFIAFISLNILQINNYLNILAIKPIKHAPGIHLISRETNWLTVCLCTWYLMSVVLWATFNWINDVKKNEKTMRIFLNVPKKVSVPRYISRLFLFLKILFQTSKGTEPCLGLLEQVLLILPLI